MIPVVPVLVEYILTIGSGIATAVAGLLSWRYSRQAKPRIVINTSVGNKAVSIDASAMSEGEIKQLIKSLEGIKKEPSGEVVSSGESEVSAPSSSEGGSGPE